MNPYYLAWLRAGGLCQPLYKFMFFIQEKHREWKITHGFKPNGIFYGFNEDEFIKYINIGPHQDQRK